MTSDQPQPLQMQLKGLLCVWLPYCVLPYLCYFECVHTIRCDPEYFSGWCVDYVLDTLLP